MGQFVDLHTRLQDLLALIQTAAGGTSALRIYDDPPNMLPEMPCVYSLTPDEVFEQMDTMMGRSRVTFLIRLCVDMGQPQLELLRLCDLVAVTADVWLRSEHPSPIDQAVRPGMRGVTPTFDGIPTRGADFSIQFDGDFRQTQTYT